MLIKKERTVRTMLFLLLFLVSFNFVSALDDSEILYCASQNMTLNTCLNFWIEVHNIVGNQTCEIINMTNQTCVNTTIIEYRDRNITIQENCTEQDALTKIDDYAKRGFEPVFSDGIITNWRKIENIECNITDTSDLENSLQACQTELIDRKDFSESSSSSDDTSWFPWVMGFFGFLCVAFIFRKPLSKMISGESLPQQSFSPYNQGPPPGYSINPDDTFSPPIPKQPPTFLDKEEGGSNVRKTPEF